MVNSSTLLGFAMLKANFNDEQKSFQDNFLEFVVEGVKSSHPEGATPEGVSKYVNEKFGLDIPSLVTRNILQRAVKLDRLQRNERTFVCSARELDRGGSVTAQFDSFVRQQNQLSQQLLDFVKVEFPEQANDLNREECGRLIARYMDVHALPLLQTGVRGTELGSISPAEADFLVSEFVAHANDSEPQVFEQLVEVAKGATLAAILKMDVSSLKASLNSLWVYHDTSIVLNLLGYHGEKEREASAEILRIARSLGAQTCVFEHTVRELRGILFAAQQTLRSGSRIDEGFRVAAYFLEQDLSAADVEIILGRLEDDINKLGLEIRSKPENYLEFGLDEKELDRLLRESLPDLSETSTRYDVDSVSAVHRLRRNSAGDKLERARAIFITRNRQIVFTANRVRERATEFPLALLESTFAALLWVRRPSLAADLPEKRVLATAWAGMQPEPNKWLQYLAEADKLVARGEMTQEDALLLRLSSVGRHELMKSVVGDPEKFLQVKPTALLEKLKDDLSSPLNEKIEELEARNAEMSSTAAIALEQVKGDLADTGVALKAAEQKALKLEHEKGQQRENLYQRAARRGRRVAGVQVFLGFLGLLVLMIIGDIAVKQAQTWLSVLIYVGGGVTALVGLLGICGVNIARLRPALARKLTDRYFAKSLQEIGLSGPAPGECEVLAARAKEVVGSSAGDR